MRQLQRRATEWSFLMLFMMRLTYWMCVIVVIQRVSGCIAGQQSKRSTAPSPNKTANSSIPKADLVNITVPDVSSTLSPQPLHSSPPSTTHLPPSTSTFASTLPAGSDFVSKSHKQEEDAFPFDWPLLEKGSSNADAEDNNGKKESNNEPALFPALVPVEQPSLEKQWGHSMTDRGHGVAHMRFRPSRTSTWGRRGANSGTDRAW
jgi:hypothetical protein